MTTTPMHSLDACRDEALSLLLEYKRATSDYRTPLLRKLADVIVEARSHFLNDEAEPDWKGLTWAYRQWVHDLYSSAHFTREETTSVQAAVRYHLGAALRDRLDEKTLIALGIMKQTPKERSRERRESRMMLLNALTKREVPHGDVMALSAVYTMLQGITGEDFTELSTRDCEVINATLADIERRVRALRRRCRR